ncbi:MAG: response regulator [Cyclobacteriaceae bacterium]|nr:response regulator [Cyclobacteriaceae bacterium]
MKKGLTILLVDDEVYAIHLMEALLRNRNGITTIFTATNRKDALELVVAQQPDIVFQDIKMMDTDGLELVDEYRKLHYEGEIVFVTAYEQYAIAAIRKAAFDYLLKPVDMDELDAVLLRLRAKMSKKA